MTDRLASHMLIGALILGADRLGGSAVVLRKGDGISGSILIQCLEKGRNCGLFERVPDYAKGGYTLAPCGPGMDSDEAETTAYLDRRMRADPDLWLIELNVPDAQRFAAETVC
jgi:hypothetical protein